MDGLLPQKLLVVYVCVFVSMPGTQDHIITLAAPAGQLCAYVSPPAKHAVSARDLQVWCVKTHIQQLLSSDENQKLNLLTKDLHSDPST